MSEPHNWEREGEDNDRFLAALGTTFPSDMVNLSGKEDEPMWVERSEVAAVGVFGPEDSMVVLRSSGVKLRCKHIHPNEVVQLVTGQVDE